MAGKKDYSKKFHNKVNNLLKKAGFKIEDVNYHKPGPDTICNVDGDKILLQCKSTKEINKPYRSLERLADEYATKVRKHRAKVAILAFQNYKIMDKYLGDKLLKRNKIVVWNDRIIDYYDKTVDSTGHYAKYSIKGDLGISDNTNEYFTVPAIKVEQNGRQFFIFRMFPEDLLKYSYVFRRQYNPKAYQRMLKKIGLKK
jgi:hypothetical protein